MISQFIEMFGVAESNNKGLNQCNIEFVCEGITDGSHAPPKGIDYSEYLMLSSKNIIDDCITVNEPRYLSKEQFETEDKRTRIKSGDVLLTIVGTVGRTAVVPEDHPNMTLQRSVCVLHPKQDVIKSKFLFYELKCMQDYIDSLAQGVAQRGIYLGQVAKIKVVVPPIEDQNRFVDILEQTDKSKFCSLMCSKSQFIEMFGNRSDKQKCLKNLFDLQMGKTPARAEKRLWKTSDYRWISIADMSTYGKYTGDTKEYLSELAVKETGIKVVPKGTVIMSFKLTVGRTAITSEDIYTNEAIMAFIPKTDQFNLDYLRYALQFYDWTDGLQNAVKGVTLNKAIIGDALFSIPPMEFQCRFAAFVEQSDKSKCIVQTILTFTMYNTN